MGRWRCAWRAAAASVAEPSPAGVLVDVLADLTALQGSAAAARRQRAVAAGVGDIIVRSPPTAAAAAAAGRPRLWRASGVHPLQADRAAPELAALQALAAQGALQAIGEIGLHGLAPRQAKLPTPACQAEVLRAQLQLARQHRLPVILHCVRRIGPLLAILEADGPLPAGGVLHAFGGPAELLPRLLRCNLWCSFGGMLTRPNSRRAQAAARQVPQARLLVESDTPDMPAQGWQGPSEPAMLPLVLHHLAALRGTSPAALAAATAANARRLFALPAA